MALASDTSGGVAYVSMLRFEGHWSPGGQTIKVLPSIYSSGFTYTFWTETTSLHPQQPSEEPDSPPLPSFPSFFLPFILVTKFIEHLRHARSLAKYWEYAVKEDSPLIPKDLTVW